MLSRANSIVNNYKRSKKEVEDRMMQRYEKLKPTKPVSPRLRTLLRAASRSRVPAVKIETDLAMYDAATVLKHQVLSGAPEFAVKHSMNFNRYSVRVRKLYEPSIIEPECRASSLGGTQTGKTIPAPVNI